MAGKAAGEKRKKSSDDEDDPPKTKIPKRESKKSLCPVCLDNLDEGDVMATPCAHIFHPYCILTSFEYTDRCPLCRHRMDMLAGYAYSGPSSNPPVNRSQGHRLVPAPTGSQRRSLSQRGARGRTARGGRSPNPSLRTRRAPTPYPNEDESPAEPAPAPANEPAPESTPSSSSGENQQDDDTVFQGEYTPNVTSDDDADADGDSDEEDADVNVEDPNDPDYIPPLQDLITFLQEDDSSESSHASTLYALNESPNAPPTEEGEQEASGEEDSLADEG